MYWAFLFKLVDAETLHDKRETAQSIMTATLELLPKSIARTKIIVTSL